MALYQAGYLSPISNKLGNAVGRKWRNLDVLAVYQPKVKNPRTGAQMIQRNKLGIISNIAQGLNYTIKRGYETVCKGTKTFPRAKFISNNIDNVNGTDLTISWRDIVVTQGNLVRPNFAMATATRPESVDVQFTYDVLATQYRDIDIDKVKVYIVAYNEETNTSAISRGVLSDAETVTLSTPSDWNGLKVYVWGFAIYEGQASDVDGLRANEASVSAFLGEVTIQ